LLGGSLEARILITKRSRVRSPARAIKVFNKLKLGKFKLASLKPEPTLKVHLQWKSVDGRNASGNDCSYTILVSMAL
jgi:hypothetical protein